GVLLVFGWIDDMTEAVQDWLIEQIKNVDEWVLDITHNLFSHSVDTVHDQVAQTPQDFSADLTNSLKAISDAAVLPVAGIILTYVFAYEIYNLVAEKNRGGDFDTQVMFFLIIKTAIVILLVSNNFTKTMAFFDLGQWMAEKVPMSELTISDDITDDVLESVDSFGSALGMLMLAGI